MNLKRIASSLLCSLMLLPALASCGSSDTATADTADTAANNGETTAQTETAADVTEYDFPEINLDGGKFTIANSNTGTWGHYYHIDFEEAIGESLDDAVYERNRALEEQFGLVIDVYEENIDDLPPLLQTAILAGEDLCDLAYIRSNKLAPFITGGYLCDLASLDGLNLDGEWWDQTVVNSRIGKDNTLYFASHYYSLMSFDGTICTYVNETMLEDLGLDKPYDLVRSGKWTYDKLFEYTEAGSNLNGDDSFGWKNDGNSVYGLATWSNGIYAMLRSADAVFTKTDSDGKPYITAGESHFINVCEMLANELYAVEGEYINKNVSNSPEHYEEIFKNGRALMLVAQIKTSNKYRELDDTFGMLPLPKYDEAQEDYISFMPESCALMCIPMTNPDAETTAALIDAFSYVSYKDVLPVYYEVNVSQKGLRNEESIEMLDIIRNNRVIDVANIFGWTTDMQNAVRTKLEAGDANVVSTVESYRSAADAAILSTFEALEK